MKNIFINGIMLDRSQIFLRELARNFHVIGEGLAPLQNEPGLNISDPFMLAGSMTREEADNLENRITVETKVLADQLVSDFKALHPEKTEQWSLPDGYTGSTLHPRVSVLLKKEAHFQLIHAAHPIDMVISGADYGSHARMTALTARKMSIPTMNLEHGFFFAQIRWQYSNLKRNMPMYFASEYLNLDSPMEAGIFEEILANFPDQDTKFLGLGTPTDTIVGQGLTREEARKRLGISSTKKVVTLVCTWIESRSINVLVTGQLNVIDLYEDIFRSLAEDDFRHDLELLIKLHPAEARPDVMPGVKACLENMAHRFGLPAPRVFGDQLPEVLTAADIVAGVGFSSVLFDVFQMGKASVVLMPPYLVTTTQPDWRRRGSIPLEEGVMEVADDPADLWRRLADWLTPSRQKKLASDVAHLTEKYDLQYRTVEEKSQKIIDWIKELLG